MKRLAHSLLVFLLGPALVALLVWGTIGLELADELFTVPGGVVVDLGRKYGLFALRDCQSSSKPQVCDLENAITDVFMRSEVGMGGWLCIASVGSAWLARRAWRRRSPDYSLGRSAANGHGVD